MIKYKLTDRKLRTHKKFQWEVGKWVLAEGNSKQKLCTNGWLHCYDSPLLAILHNPIHTSIKNPRLWKVEVGGECKNDRGLKCGYQKMRLVKEIPVPEISLTQKIAYGILCAKRVYNDSKFLVWADNWLSGKDRSSHAADASCAAAEAAIAAAYAAADAARATAYAAANTTARADKTTNFVKLAKQAMSFEP
jgi:hypothetical protein